MTALTEILSSKTRAEFFRLFFGLHDEELHLRRIERESGFTIGPIRQEAGKLASLGLLHKRTDGNRTYYRANKDHPLYPDIHALTVKTTGLSDLLVKAFEGAPIHMAFVYGSAAKGNLEPDSDIDLFVIGDIGLRELSKRLAPVSDKLGREVNIYTITQSTLQEKIRANNHFIQSVLNSPTLMIIGDQDELTDLVR
ncbi:MAG: nucleotidyltransferase domain-containing protein [Candidatus Marinimicrobia bacterium]|nr:nucleotidyltransferase domain-containing protein [Candidatus Neomarinimicrobiota bacterium]MCF7851122.1 nucleotidyltransferase domain-containing protein [Candidatus Neomarinimicrobiota bacterium]MCF7904330.1 nucleotidyltransferase domain-containing protein [Candidatus Neomarinimicrobiota bacterium]